MTNEEIHKQLQFFAESDWNSQRIIYLDALERLAAERDRADRAETRLAQILEYADSTYTASTVARRIVQMGRATA